MERKLPRQSSSEDSMSSLIKDFLESVTSVHKAHLRVSGPGSYAAHKAMGEFYEEIGELADGVAESYQGLTGKLLNLKGASQPTLTTKNECIEFLTSLYTKIDSVQKICTHSEIINDLDNAKTLINQTKYKLLFLQ